MLNRDLAKDLRSSADPADAARAEILYESAISEFDEVLTREPEKLWVKASAAAARKDFADMMRQRPERYAKAEELYRRAIAGYRQIPNLPDLSWVARSIADARWELGRLYARWNRFDEAAQCLEEAVESYRKVTETADPEIETMWDRLLHAQLDLRTLYRQFGKKQDAERIDRQINSDERRRAESAKLSTNQ